ncbi:MAG: cyclic nucleotide-binding domain-containing protein [Dehalococcoidia bacterium]
MGREDMLKSVPIFSELGKRDLERLAKLMVPRTVKAGEVVIKENDQAAGFFVVASGKLEAVRGADSGNPQVLATYGPGDFFGEMALFEGFPRSATVRAVEDSECLAMTRWDFTAEMKNHPEIAVSMLPVLVRRLRNADAKLAE